MNVTTRPGTKGDLDFARNAHHSAYRDVVVRQWGRWDEDLQDRFFDRDWGDARFDVILVGETVCGYTSIEDRADAVHVRELVLLPEYQGRGIGSALLRSVIARAKTERKLVRQRSCIENHRARSLYERHGFREIDREETHILLESGVGDR